MTANTLRRRRSRRLLQWSSAFFVLAVLWVAVESPQSLVPRPPYWRWALALVVTVAFAFVAEVGFERMWHEVEDVKGSRDTAVKWGVTILAILVAAGLLAGTVLVWWLLLRPPVGAAV